MPFKKRLAIAASVFLSIEMYSTLTSVYVKLIDCGLVKNHSEQVPLGKHVLVTTVSLLLLFALSLEKFYLTT